MRWFVLLAVVVGAVIVGGFLMLSAKGEPAAKVLQGVSVAGNGLTVRQVPDGGHELRLGIIVSSSRTIDRCLAFALDEPFAGREMKAVSGCVRPQQGNFAATILLAHLTDSDIAFVSHTVIWGLSGGDCGLWAVMGICQVDSAGTFDIELPSKTRPPTFGPFRTFGPLFSYKPFAP